MTEEKTNAKALKAFLNRDRHTVARSWLDDLCEAVEERRQITGDFNKIEKWLSISARIDNLYSELNGYLWGLNVSGIMSEDRRELYTKQLISLCAGKYDQGGMTCERL